MKTLLLPALILLFSAFLSAQTSVDRVVRAIDSLSLSSFDGWKASPDLRSLRGMTGDPTKPGFDDSHWETLNLNQSIYPDSCWIRKEISLPQTYLGAPVRGPVKFLVSVDDYGYLWVNGESKGYFPWDGEFELTKDARPGEKFTIAIKAINTGGPLRLLRAEIQTAATSVLRSGLDDFTLSLRVGQKLLSFDTYQTSARKKEDPGTDKSKMDAAEKKRLGALLQDLAAHVDVDALGRGDMERFNASLAETRSKLKPVGDFAKRFTIFLDANAHIDAAWLWRDKETIEVCRNTFTSVLNMMDARPDFTYTQSAAAYYDWMDRLAPDVYNRMQKRVADGRWEIVGGMWVEPDCNLPGGESWMRHLLYAERYFQKKFGKTAKIGWNPDSFGYNWNMPEFYASAGIDDFITQKIGWNESNVFPYRLFWWQSRSGARVLSYFPFDYVNTIDDPFRLTDWVRQYEANTGLTKMMILFGVGDHGGGPSDEMLDRITRLKKLDVYPAIEYGTAAQYLAWVRGQDLSSVPVWDDELYLEYHQGTYTTQAAMKEWNRKSEVLLTNAEKFSAIAMPMGKEYRSHDLEEAWRNVLFNQFHDILPGSGIRENYIDATEKFRASAEIGKHELDDALGRIAGSVNTSRVTHGKPVVVFNPAGWTRTDVATVEIPAEGDYAVFASGGREIPSQVESADKYRRNLFFVAESIPSLGYATYELRKTAPAAQSIGLKTAPGLIENNSFRVTVDSGWVKGIYDKRMGKEILTGRGNELQLLEDRPSAWDAWNIGLTGVQYPLRLRGVEVSEKGPVRIALRVTWDYLKPGEKKDPPTPEYPNSFFTQTVYLYDGIDRIEFRTDADWWEEKTMLKVAFPLTFTDSNAVYEIPYGTIARSTRMDDRWEKAKVEVPAERWADVTHDGYGVALLNRSKYGYDIKGNTMRLSLLRSPKWPDPTADRGKHEIEYALYPHKGTWQEAGVERRGIEYNTPFVVSLTGAHAGKLPSRHSFVSLEPANVVLATLKKAEDSGEWVAQIFETAGLDTDARLTLSAAPKEAELSDALEKTGTPLTVKKNTVTVPVKKYATSVVKIGF